MSGPQDITAECLNCKRKFSTEFVSLMGHEFLRERYCPLCLESERRSVETGGRGKMEEVAVIKEVTKKTIRPRNGNPEFVLYEIEAGEHKWTTRKSELALTAHALVGKTAMIMGKVQQKDQYTNYYLDSIQETDAPVTSDVFADSPNGNDTLRNTTDDRQESIHRQVATKVAAQLADNASDFWNNVDLLMNFYVTGTHPGGDNATATETDTQFTGDDDIPF